MIDRMLSELNSDFVRALVFMTGTKYLYFQTFPKCINIKKPGFYEAWKIEKAKRYSLEIYRLPRITML